VLGASSAVTVFILVEAVQAVAVIDAGRSRRRALASRARLASTGEDRIGHHEKPRITFTVEKDFNKFCIRFPRTQILLVQILAVKRGLDVG
jgi:hypothetical protein